MNALFSRLEIQDEPGVLQARQQARLLAERLGFAARDRLGISSSVTHATCEAIRHAGGAVVEFRLEEKLTPDPSLIVLVMDRGPSGVDLAPGYPRSFEAASRGMDRFEVENPEGRGTVVSMAWRLPSRSLPIEPTLVASVADELAGLPPPSPITELLDQDLALFRSFDESQSQKREMSRMNAELEDSKIGIQALHAELAERADWLRNANDLKTRFLSRVSHELRTPLASILSLARLLLDRADGELAIEQERQVSFILRAAHELMGLINDLLDLARLEAGRETVHLSRVQIPEFFATLRGMFRPMVPPSSTVALVFEEPGDLPPLWTDEGKLTQILRNLLSNALQFTRNGEIRVLATPGPDDSVLFSVSDTGEGIAPENLERVFEEFSQCGGWEPSTAPGAGLGLPMARRLARVLGGRVEVRSDPGVGSTFTAIIPTRSAVPSHPLGDDRIVP